MWIIATSEKIIWEISDALLCLTTSKTNIYYYALLCKFQKKEKTRSCFNKSITLGY